MTKEQIEKLLKERKFATFLASDKEFVEEVKQTCYENGIEIKEEEIIRLLRDIETSLAEKRILEDEELEAAVGGRLNYSDTSGKVIGGIIHGAVTAIGSVLSAGVGLFLSSEITMEREKKDAKTGKTRPLKLSKIKGTVMYPTISGIAGGYTSYQLGKKIADLVVEGYNNKPKKNTPTQVATDDENI